MTKDIYLAAIVGSLRANSVTHEVFEAAAEIFRSQAVELTEASLTDVPLYNGDIEAAGDPLAVVALKRTVEDSDGLVVFTPEYNRSVPAVTKNAVDWLSRPYGGSPLAGKPVGIIAQSPGGHDARGVRSHLSVSVAANTGHLFEETLGLRRTPKSLYDNETRQQLVDWCERFAAYVSETRSVHV